MKITMIVLNSIWHDPRVRRAATSANNEGYDVCVVGIKDHAYNEQKIRDLPFKTIIAETDTNLQRGDISIFKKIYREYSTFKKCFDVCVKIKPDLIHANDLNALQIAYFAAKKTKAKVVYDSHELFCENANIVSNKVKRFYWKIIERYLIKRVYKVVSVSNAAAKQLSDIYRIPMPIVVTNAAFPVDEKLLHVKNAEEFEVLIHGKFYKGRGYETLVRTANLLKGYKDIKFVIRGLGQLEEELKKLADELEVNNNNVYFDPPVLVTDMVSYAARSHVGIAITEPINDNFKFTVSNKLFEYITAGLPVILSDVPEHRYLNDKYNFGIILEENTPECLAREIVTLYENKILYKELCNNAKKTAKILNWNTEVKKLFEIYNEA